METVYDKIPFIGLTTSSGKIWVSAKQIVAIEEFLDFTQVTLRTGETVNVKEKADKILNARWFTRADLTGTHTNYS